MPFAYSRPIAKTFGDLSVGEAMSPRASPY
jgi:hypothetical protein